MRFVCLDGRDVYGSPNSIRCKVTRVCPSSSRMPGAAGVVNEGYDAPVNGLRRHLGVRDRHPGDAAPPIYVSLTSRELPFLAHASSSSSPSPTLIARE